MRKALLPLLALAASVTWASTASAGTWYTRIANRTCSIRATPNTFQLGTLPPGWGFTFHSDHVYRTPDGNLWRFGVHHTDNPGRSDKCGWVRDIFLDYYPNTFSSPCSSSVHKSEAQDKDSRIFLRSLYACAVNDYVPSGGTQPFFSDSSTGTNQLLRVATQLWGNYDYFSETCTGPALSGVLPVGTTFAWRWISDRSGVVLGKSAGSGDDGNWGFIPRGCLDTKLPYRDYGYPYYPANDPLQRHILRADWEAGG